MTGAADQMAALQARIYEALQKIDEPLQKALGERLAVKTEDLGDGTFRHTFSAGGPVADELLPEKPLVRTAFHAREARRQREAVEALEELLDPLLNPAPTIEDLAELEREMLRIVRESSGPPSKARPHPALTGQRKVIGARRKVSIDKPPAPPSAKFKAHRKKKRRMERRARRGR